MLTTGVKWKTAELAQMICYLSPQGGVLQIRRRYFHIYIGPCDQECSHPSVARKIDTSTCINQLINLNRIKTLYIQIFIHCMLHGLFGLFPDQILGEGGWIYNGYRSAIHCMNSYFIFQNKENNLICIHPLNAEGNLVPMFFLMNNLISSKFYDTALHTSHHEFQFILQEPMSWV